MGTKTTGTSKTLILVYITTCALFPQIRMGCGQAPPAGPSKSCDDTLKRIFDMAASFAEGLEPIELVDQQICSKVEVTGLSTLQLDPGRNSYLVSAPAPSNANLLQTGFRLAKLHVECHIIPLSNFTKLLGLNTITNTIPDITTIPLLGSGPGPGNGSPVEPMILVADGGGTNGVDFDLDLNLNLEDDLANITKLEMSQGALDALQISLKGNALFTKLGDLITKPKSVRSSLGFVIKYVLRQVMTQFVNDPSLKEVRTMLNNCGDEDY